MKTKTFDCVRMKREAAEKIYSQVKTMSLEEELRFWNSTTEADWLALRETNIEKATASAHSLEQVKAITSSVSA